MMAYVATVAIVNTLLGFFLTRWLWQADSRCKPAALEPNSEATQPIAEERVRTPRPASAVKSVGHPATSAAPSAIDPRTSAASQAQQREDVAKKSQNQDPHRDAMHELRNIRDRLSYCRSSGDKRLIRNLTDSLRDRSEAWHAKLVKCMAEGSNEFSTMFDGSDPCALEMYAAQVETTLTNIQMLNWDDTAQEILARLEGEILLLLRGK